MNVVLRSLKIMKIDPLKSPKANLADLIYHSNFIRLYENQFEVIHVLPSDLETFNTRVKIKGIEAFKLTGKKEFFYNRIMLNQLVDTPIEYALTEQSNKESIVMALSVQLGIDHDHLELIGFPPTESVSESSLYTLKAKDDSLLYCGTLMVTLIGWIKDHEN